MFFSFTTVIRIPRPPLSDSYSCDLHWTIWNRQPVSLPHLMAQISVIRLTRSTLLRIAQCIMTEWLGEVRFNWNDSGTSRTRGSRLSQGLEVSRDGFVGVRERRKVLSRGKKRDGLAVSHSSVWLFQLWSLDWEVVKSFLGGRRSWRRVQNRNLGRGDGCFQR